MTDRLHGAQALPKLEDAVRSLKQLKISDVQEVGAYKSPPAGVKLVMEAVRSFELKLNNGDWSDFAVSFSPPFATDLHHERYCTEEVS